MTRKYRVIVQPPAIAELREAFRYIEEQDGRGRAEHWFVGIRDSIDALEYKPGMHALVQLRQGRIIRSKLAMKSFRIYFIVDDARRVVDVIDVVHTARETKLSGYRDDP